MNPRNECTPKKSLINHFLRSLHFNAYVYVDCTVLVIQLSCFFKCGYGWSIYAETSQHKELLYTSDLKKKKNR